MQEKYKKKTGFQKINFLSTNKQISSLVKQKTLNFTQIIE